MSNQIVAKYNIHKYVKYESFEPLIGFLAFLVQKLWPKNNKIIK